VRERQKPLPNLNLRLARVEHEADRVARDVQPRQLGELFADLQDLLSLLDFIVVQINLTQAFLLRLQLLDTLDFIFV
jgi:uncharacterized protein YmfQ (DUF2313 family)